MKIAVASTGRWLESTVDYHTGRAACFILYNTEDETFNVLDNWRCTECVHWAGLKSAYSLVEEEADVLIVRNVGANTFRRLAEAQIKVYLAGEVKVSRAIRSLREGRLPVAVKPNCSGHNHR